MPHSSGPMKAARFAARRAVHRYHVTERHAQRSKARKSHGAHGEIFVVGIDLHLNWPVELEAVLLLVSSDCALQLRLEIGAQQLGFFPVQLENGVAGPERDVILIAVEQTQ